MADSLPNLIARSQQGDRDAAEKLVCDNSRLIWSIVRRFMGHGVETEDLYQLGCIGFLKAVEGFDPGFGTQFSTYAVPKIAGEIRRFLRDDGAVKVSRSTKEKAAQIHKARSCLLQALNREPTVSELSAKTGLDIEEIAACETAMLPIDSLQRETAQDGLCLEQTLADTGQEDKLLEHLALSEAMEKLPERELLVLRLRFFHGMTQQKAAGILGISQVQVSRLEKRATDRLREKMQDI